MGLIKDGDLDREAALKYLNTAVKEVAWKTVVMESFDICDKDIAGHVAEVQKRSGFTKEECNVKYEFMTDCIDIALFTVSYHLCSF